MTLLQVSPRVHVETEHLGSNNSILIADDGVILVDSPHRPTDAKEWSQVASGFGEVKFIVNTDHHPDHTIGNFWIPGIVVSHEGTRRRLLEDPPTGEYLRDLMKRIDPEALPFMDTYSARVPTVVFSERLRLHLSGVALELSFRPGHTANSLVAYCPEERVVFTGDNVCEAGLPSFQDSTVTDWFDALDTIEDIDFDVLVPGHGEVTTKKAVGEYRDLGRQLVARVANALRQGYSRDRTSDEVRFEDNIHVDTEKYVGYPEELIETFQRRSIARIYDNLVQDPSLVTR